jgi:hypothetical protein
LDELVQSLETCSRGHDVGWRGSGQPYIRDDICLKAAAKGGLAQLPVHGEHDERLKAKMNQRFATTTRRVSR